MAQRGESGPMVVFILGWGRSGSTFLDSLLGAAPGVATLGEVMYFAHRGLFEARLCGCGATIPECPVWSAVAAELEPDLQRLGGAVGVEHLRDRVCAPSAVLGQFLARDRPYARPGDDERRYARFHQRFYQAASEHLGERVLIDSSKHPAHAAAIASVCDLPCRFVHLVREPRAVAHSLRKRKDMRDGSGLEQTRRTILRAALSWVVFNRICRRMVAADPHGISLRYEDLCAQPEASLRRILASVDPELQPAPITSGRYIHLPVNHSISGNPGRFSTGDVEIRLDNGWERNQPVLSQSLVRAVTRGEARHYGYA